MLVIRIAFSDPQKSEARAKYTEAHKDHLRSGLIKVLESGPIFDDFGSALGGVVVAEVASVAEMQNFSASDPFVVHRVYENVSIHEWRQSIRVGG